MIEARSSGKKSVAYIGCMRSIANDTGCCVQVALVAGANDLVVNLIRDRPPPLFGRLFGRDEKGSTDSVGPEQAAERIRAFASDRGVALVGHYQDASLPVMQALMRIAPELVTWSGLSLVSSGPTPPSSALARAALLATMYEDCIATSLISRVRHDLWLSISPDDMIDGLHVHGPLLSKSWGPENIDIIAGLSELRAWFARMSLVLPEGETGDVLQQMLDQLVNSSSSV